MSVPRHEREPELWALEVEAVPAELARVDAFAEDLFQRLCPEEGERLSFVLREAVLNALEAMAESEGKERIEIEVSVDWQGIVICIIDQGFGFQPEWQEKLAEASMEDCLLDERGRGLLFIRQMVDEIWSFYQPERGHVFGMRKRWKGV
ncbi:ATP-binding protein [Azotosporobacter soli]|uniref:ATP-binding protein n=1 Tax=Azotosporobacter soli TaxID=3055040 RepID=UPI0031FF33C0